jgi:hypothetical protein
MLDKKDEDKEYRKILEEMGIEKSEDEPLTEQELRQIFIYNKIMEGEKTMLQTLTAKIDELSKTIDEKKIYTKDKIKENPLAYIAGSFLGGVVVGYVMGKVGNSDKCDKGKDDTNCDKTS